MANLVRMCSASALLVGAVLGGAAPAAVAAGPPPGEQSVTVHRVAPVLKYRLEERLETGGQIDGGTVRVTYTCHRGAGEPFVFAHVFAGGFMGPTFGEDIPCDDRRHTVRLGVSRKTDAPYTPPGKFMDADLSLGFSTEPGGNLVPGAVIEPVRIRFIGF